ncbi:hypothetical protein TNCV_4237581 [Trichonephila clavipes]|nr:hypothetical protein TNCV_4237581 [Trichonephila clavipes]
MDILDRCDCVRMSATLAEPPNSDAKDGRKCTPHIVFSSETCSWLRNLFESKVVPYKDAFRSGQRVVVRFLISEDAFNGDIQWE